MTLREEIQRMQKRSFIKNVKDFQVPIKTDYFTDGLAEVKKHVEGFKSYETVRKAPAGGELTSAELKVFDAEGNYIVRVVLSGMFNEYVKIRLDFDDPVPIKEV